MLISIAPIRLVRLCLFLLLGEKKSLGVFCAVRLSLVILSMLMFFLKQKRGEKVSGCYFCGEDFDECM